VCCSGVLQLCVAVVVCIVSPALDTVGLLYLHHSCICHFCTSLLYSYITFVFIHSGVSSGYDRTLVFASLLYEHRRATVYEYKSDAHTRVLPYQGHTLCVAVAYTAVAYTEVAYRPCK